VEETGDGVIDETPAQLTAANAAQAPSRTPVTGSLGKTDQSVPQPSAHNPEERSLLAQAGQSAGAASGIFLREDGAPPITSRRAQANGVGLEVGPPAIVSGWPAALNGPATESLVSAEGELPASPGLLATVLPVDFSGLEASVKDFFDQIEQLGLTMTASQADLLFSTGMVAVAAAVAAEITRRRLQVPAAPALPRGHGSLPYSDYR
jgi:hypothetical protein